MLRLLLLTLSTIPVQGLEAVYPSEPGECCCTRSAQVVCGTDGQTYINPCVAQCNGVGTSIPGACNDKDHLANQRPTHGSPDLEEELSNSILEASGSNAECICPRRYYPVCGEDGVSYSNPCLARCNGVHRFIHNGLCEQDKQGKTAGSPTSHPQTTNEHRPSHMNPQHNTGQPTKAPTHKPNWENHVTMKKTSTSQKTGYSTRGAHGENGGSTPNTRSPTMQPWTTKMGASTSADDSTHRNVTHPTPGKGTTVRGAAPTAQPTGSSKPPSRTELPVKQTTPKAGGNGEHENTPQPTEIKTAVPTVSPRGARGEHAPRTSHWHARYAHALSRSSFPYFRSVNSRPRLASRSHYMRSSRWHQSHNPPCICHAIYQPVCATNGQTFSNGCKAKCSGATIAHAGRCKY